MILIIAADIETADGLLGCKFAIGCWLKENFSKVMSFTKQDEFVYSLLRACSKTNHKRGNRVYFHNLDFDGRFLIDTFLKDMINFKLIRRGGRLLAIKVFWGGKEITFADSYSLIPVALEKFPSIFNLNMVKPDLSDLRKRCEADCRILMAGLKAFFKYYPYAKGAMTLPQAAYREIKANLPSSVFFTSDGENVNEELEKTARLGYFGGRVEAFSLKYHEDVRHYDVNSMYPYVMMNFEYPVGIAHASSINNARRDGLLYVARANVKIPECFIPALPFRMSRLYFAKGVVSGWFYSPELELAYDLGYDVEVEKFYAFYSDKIFEHIIREHYSKRLEHKRNGNGLEKVEKLIMNSAYGKFAQARTYDELEVVAVVEEGCEILYDDGEGIVAVKRIPNFNNTKYINPFVSGFVTSYARVELFKYLNKVGDSAIYCDTDSIVTSEHLVESEQLGGLKLEYKGPFQAFGAKIYWEQGKVKAKGFSIKGEAFDDPQSFAVFLQKGTLKQIYAKPWESLKKGKVLMVKSLAKTLREKYRKRKVLRDGSTEPWYADEIEQLEVLPAYLAAQERAYRDAYEKWRASDYYDYHAEDSSLTSNEKYEEFKERWKDYAFYY